jgi:hypothetical protein
MKTQLEQLALDIEDLLEELEGMEHLPDDEVEARLDELEREEEP